MARGWSKTGTGRLTRRKRWTVIRKRHNLAKSECVLGADIVSCLVSGGRCGKAAVWGQVVRSGDGGKHPELDVWQNPALKGPLPTSHGQTRVGGGGLETLWVWDPLPVRQSLLFLFPPGGFMKLKRLDKDYNNQLLFWTLKMLVVQVQRETSLSKHTGPYCWNATNLNFTLLSITCYWTCMRGEWCVPQQFLSYLYE